MRGSAGRGLYLGGPKEADGLQVLHGLPVGRIETLEEVHLLLQDLGLRVHHAHDTGLRAGGDRAHQAGPRAPPGRSAQHRSLPGPGPAAHRLPVHEEHLHARPAVLDHLGHVLLDSQHRVHPGSAPLPSARPAATAAARPPGSCSPPAAGPAGRSAAPDYNSQCAPRPAPPPPPRRPVGSRPAGSGERRRPMRWGQRSRQPWPPRGKPGAARPCGLPCGWGRTRAEEGGRERPGRAKAVRDEARLFPPPRPGHQTHFLPPLPGHPTSLSPPRCPGQQTRLSSQPPPTPNRAPPQPPGTQPGSPLPAPGTFLRCR